MSKRVTDFFKRSKKTQNEESINVQDQEDTVVEEETALTVSEEPSPSGTCVPGEQQGNDIAKQSYEQFRPPSNFSFPKTKVGSRLRSCQYQWFDQYKWLHYDTKYDPFFIYVSRFCLLNLAFSNVLRSHYVSWPSKFR